MKFITEKSRGIHISDALLKMSELDKEAEYTFSIMPRALLTMPKAVSFMDMLILLTGLRLMYEEVRDDLLDHCDDGDEYESLDDTEELMRDYAIRKACDEVVSHFTLFTPAEKAGAEDAINAIFDELMEMKINMPALFAGLLFEEIYE